MHSREPPLSAAWWHHQARSGFEVAFFHVGEGDLRIVGGTAASEQGRAWIVDYELHLVNRWCTSWARVHHRSITGVRSIELETDGEGHWRLDGHPAPDLDGCLDVDLESSAMTNALPVHRLALGPGQSAAAPAAYVRAADLAVERLEQLYVRVGDDNSRQRYAYTAPALGFTAELEFDETGLVLGYPGLAIRAG